MPYIRDKDFVWIKELLETIEDLSEKKENEAIHDIAARALKVMEGYIVEHEEEEE